MNAQMKLQKRQSVKLAKLAAKLIAFDSVKEVSVSKILTMTTNTGYTIIVRFPFKCEGTGYAVNVAVLSEDGKDNREAFYPYIANAAKDICELL